jgi:ribosomal protein RSM22 (predicted rRNA methylase)
MFELPPDLADAIGRLTGRSHDQLATTTQRLIDRYQADTPATPGKPIMSGDREALAYAAYRMPATYAAIRTVLDQLPDGIMQPDASHLDVAGGTGAAVWAVADRWPEVGSHTVLEQSAAAIELGRRLLSTATTTAARTRWQQSVINDHVQLPPADVTTIGYLLSEIDEKLRRQLIDAALDSTRRLLIITEPGTKKGYRRILDARDQTIGAGWHLVAPCPHQLTCPLQERPGDWCHFSARLNRSSVHRRIKGAELGYEDEKFSYLVVAPEPADRAEGRVLRHPQFGKGRVELMVCQDSGAASRVTVGKRDHDRYRAARKIEWGDQWP